MSANLFILRIAKTIHEQRDLDDRHLVINDEETIVNVLSRGKIQNSKLSESRS